MGPAAAGMDATRIKRSAPTKAARRSSTLPRELSADSVGKMTIPVAVPMSACGMSIKRSAHENALAAPSPIFELILPITISNKGLSTNRWANQ